MSSSRGPSSSAGGGGNRSNADNNDDSLFVGNGSDDGNYSEGEPEPWLPAGNNDGDESEGGEEEENQPDMDIDNSSEVGPEVMDETSDDEEERRSRRRRRARNPNPRPRTCRNCAVITRQWHDEVTRINTESQETERNLKSEIRRLNEEVERLKADNRIVWKPWGRRLGEFLKDIRDSDPNLVGTDYGGYHSIYHETCQQGIMSTSIKFIHPDLHLQVNTVYSGSQIQDHFKSQMISDGCNVDFNDLTSEGVHRAYRDMLFPWRCTRPRPLQFLEFFPFKFEDLPIAIQCRIWKLLIPNGQLMHCLSRMDPGTPPLDCMEEVVPFPSRFHIGKTPCSIAKADKPSRYLKFLQVSKRWFYATAHLFYATNTFAFSSLGEFGRFCQGIGKARVERLVHVELMWQGALTPRQSKGVSIRKRPLSWFMYTSRLRTLVVHINESAKLYMRRPYEMMNPKDYYKDFASDEDTDDEWDIFQMESKRTDRQPNYRKNRGMRTVQGMDFIYQLRGMRYVRFYDSNAQQARRQIRDWSFLQDINNVVRRRKSDSMALKTEIENLRPLTTLDDFIPDDQLNELVKRFYDETPVEDVSVNGSETSLSSGSSGISGLSTFSSDFDSDSDDDDDDGSGGPSRRSSPRGSHHPDIDQVVEIIDSDTEMEDDGGSSDGPNDNGSQPTYIDLSETMSDSGRSSRSRSTGTDGYPYESGLHTTVTPQPPPQPPVVVIEDDDNNDGRRRRRGRGGDVSTDSGGLFVRSGSCTAPTDNVPSSDNERPNEVIDLTLDDVDEEHQGSADPDPDESEGSGSASNRSMKRSGSDDDPG
ncbi:hypothetical protein CHU98_g1930 [Xylaria longipes]|nr:hypothetical protein CHU98_g1930 [Xylaria longipes]